MIIISWIIIIKMFINITIIIQCFFFISPTLNQMVKNWWVVHMDINSLHLKIGFGLNVISINQIKGLLPT